MTMFTFTRFPWGKIAHVQAQKATTLGKTRWAFAKSIARQVLKAMTKTWMPQRVWSTPLRVETNARAHQAEVHVRPIVEVRLRHETDEPSRKTCKQQNIHFARAASSQQSINRYLAYVFYCASVLRSMTSPSCIRIPSCTKTSRYRRGCLVQRSPTVGNQNSPFHGHYHTLS